MKNILIFFFALLWMTLEGQSQTNLRLIKALPIEGPKRCEPSGLILYRSELFTISDKHSNTIFKIILQEDKASLVPAIEFQTPPIPGIKRLDLEGITCDPDGNFYLASEETSRILRVSSDGKKADWITPDLQPYGKNKELLKVKNAGLEGIAYVAPNHFLVCAERHQRGILEIFLAPLPIQILVSNCQQTKLNLPLGRFPDFADLFFEDGVLYALERNAEAIVQLKASGETYEETNIWSFSSTVNRETFIYTHTLFGNIEGFCMDRDRIFLITDNNGDARRIDPKDRRPLLFIFERPKP